MDRIRIVGGNKLNGTISISGAKNAALPLMIAGLLSDETLILDNVPRLADVAQLQPILAITASISPRWASVPAISNTRARPCTFRRPTSSTPPHRTNWYRG